jgi:hypothetical protein
MRVKQVVRLASLAFVGVWCLISTTSANAATTRCASTYPIEHLRTSGGYGIGPCSDARRLANDWRAKITYPTAGGIRFPTRLTPEYGELLRCRTRTITAGLVWSVRCSYRLRNGFGAVVARSVIRFHYEEDGE